MDIVELGHAHYDGVGDHVSIFGLAVVVDKLAIGIEQVDNDCVVHYVVIVIVLRARAKVDSI